MSENPLSINKTISPVELERFRQPFFDYPNQIWSIAAHFRFTCHSNMEEFRKYIGENPLPSLTAHYGEDARQKLTEHVGERADKLDDIIQGINAATDEKTLKTLINKALFVVYPKRGPLQEFEGSEYNPETKE